MRLWLRIFNLELEVYRDTRQIDRAVVLISEIEKYLVKYKQEIPDTYSLMLSYQIGYMFILKKDYSSALHWINKILNSNYAETRNELQCYARVLNFIIHFELDNIIVLRYAVDNARRFFKKKKLSSHSLSTVLRMFSKLSLAGPEQYSEIFLDSLKTLSENLKTDDMSDYIDIPSWIESKIRNSVSQSRL